MRQYIKIECKRLLHILPGFFLSLVSVLLFGIFTVLLATHFLPEAFNIKPFRVGLCVEGVDIISDYVKDYVKQMESTENLMEFSDMTGGEIEKGIQDGSLTAGIIIPERTAESVMDGTNIPIRVLFDSGTGGAERYLQKELLILLTECGAALIDVPQAETLLLYEMQAENPEEIGKLLDLFHLGLVADRENWFETETVSAFGGVEAETYYLASALTLLSVFWGLGCGSFFGKQEKNLPLLLERQGIPLAFQQGVKQVLFFALYLILWAAFMIWRGSIKTAVPLLLCCFMVSLQCGFFFELAPTAASGVVLNCIWGFAGFVGAGGMLPTVFLPKGLTEACGRLPVGICMELLRQSVAGGKGAGGNSVWLCVLWCVIFGILGQAAFYARQWTKKWE